MALGVSDAIRGLEALTGERFLNRTNRSVTLTAAGKELQTALTAAGEAVENLHRLRCSGRTYADPALTPYTVKCRPMLTANPAVTDSGLLVQRLFVEQGYTSSKDLPWWDSSK